MSRTERRALVDQLGTVLHRRFGDQLIALGLYGSAGRGADLPYSDIEMHCVVHGERIDRRLEWSVGPWKAEVDIRSEDVILERAAELDGTWPITHGEFAYVLSLVDPGDLFAVVRDTALSHTDVEFCAVMHDLIVGEIYEYVGKVRNCRHVSSSAAVPTFAIELAKYGACLIGLAHQYIYHASATMFEESLALPDRPGGYDELSGLLVDPKLLRIDSVCDLADRFWSGVEVWARAHGLKIYEETSEAFGRLLPLKRSAKSILSEENP